MKTISRFSPIRCGVLAMTLAASLCAAPPAWAGASDESFSAMLDQVALIPPGVHDSDMLAKVAQAVGFLKRMDLPHAQQAINEALQLDARNSYLHLLNGFVYHLQARQGDMQKTDLAIEGYQQALRLDPSNWIAQEFLGLAYTDIQQYDRAKAAFSDVLLMTPDSRVSMFGLMVTSYLTGDAPSACAMADQFRKTPDPLPASFMRSSIAVYAACAKFDQAERMRQALVALEGDGPDVARASRRLAQWKAFYARAQSGEAPEGSADASAPSPVASSAAPRLVPAQAFTLQPPAAAPRAAASAPQPPHAAGTGAAAADAAAPAGTDTAASDGHRMLLVDVVLLSTDEMTSTSKGINLLSALRLELGSIAGNLPGYSHSVTSTLAGGADATSTTTITRAVTVPALSYSLNIANANSTVNQVLARPTLAAVEGAPSEFFSGTNLSAGLVSTSTQGGTTVVPLEKQFGIKLAVTPTFLSGGRVQLKVEARRTALDAAVDNPKAAYQIEIGETTANANVVMNLGETLILSGLSEKSSSTTRDGVPGLQDVPVVQYLFSNKKTNDIHRSVLVLVTPRSAEPLARAPEEAGGDAAAMKALREQFGIAERIPPNAQAILSQLRPNELFREFRQGDVSMERWDRSTVDRLKEALGFLYY